MREEAVFIDDNPKKVIRYPNATSRRYLNKRVTVVRRDDDTFAIEIVNYDKENAELPAAIHLTKKGVVRVTELNLSRETLNSIAMSILEILAKEVNLKHENTTRD